MKRPKTLCLLLTLLLSSFSGFIASTQAAGSISGTVSYSGSQTGTAIVAVFEFPLSCVPSNPDPYSYKVTSIPGSYTISDLPDGTYYVASAVMTCGMDCKLQSTDPWGIYGGCDTSIPVVISGGSAVSGISINLVDGTAESPNPFNDPYDTWADSRHQNNGYWVSLGVRDESHSLTSVRVTGPGLAGWTNLVFDTNEWKLENSISFGSTHPAPPLTYDFEIIDSDVTHFQTEIVEHFLGAFATNLSPASGESVTGTPVFSWTGPGDGYEYNVGVYGNGINWYSSGTTETSVVYAGPPLTAGQAYNWYVMVRDRYGNFSQTSDQSFVYTNAVTLTVVTEGSGGGTVTTSPTGIDCGTDCENDYPLNGQVRLTAGPNPGSVFAGWSGGGCYGIGDCFPDLSSNTTVTATFSLAGSISGTVSYSGSPTGTIYVAAFTSPISCASPNPQPYKYIEIPSPGSYTLPDLPDGTYYMGSVIISCGADCDLQSTDPWGIYGGCDTSIPVVISGGSAMTGINIDLIDGTSEAPNPVYDSYRANANSRHENSACYVWLSVDDQAHNASSVSVTGPGISGSTDLAFDTDEWKPAESISFGATHPALPLTYTFTINDSEGTHIRTKNIESFVHVFAANLSPSGGEFVIGTPVFSWTGMGSGYTYNVGVNGYGVDWQARNLTATSVTYDGPSLTPGQTYYWYVEVRDVYENISKAQQESFVYTQEATLTIVKNGSGSVTSSPEGIDCGIDCDNKYPAGSKVNLSAVPDSGSVFAGWSGGGCNGIGNCIPALISNTTVTATFAVPGSNPITLSVSPASLPADSSTGFTFQTQSPTIGGTILFELFHDVDSNGVIDGNEWPIWKKMFSDNQYANYDGFLSGDTNASVLQMAIDFDFNGGLFPAGDYIARVTNAIGESDTVPLAITPVSSSQTVEGFVYEKGTTTPIPNVVVHSISPVTESFVSAAFSGSDGAFSMLIPTPGNIAVGSEKEGYISDDDSLVTVPAGGIANQNLYLILPDTQITGSVTGYYTGSPVWGAEVRANVDGADNRSVSVTDIDGNFSLPALDGVEWRIDLDEPPGFFGGLAVTHNFESDPVIVPTVSGPNRVDFTVHKIDAWIDGTILDEYGSLEIEGADFHVARINTPDLALQRLYNDGSSDASGQVSVGVENGDWRANLSVSSVRVDGTPKEMVPPGQTDVLNLLIGEHRPVTMLAYYADGAVEGTVYEADGVTPAADIAVDAHSADALNGPAQISVGPINTNTRTNANGHYRLPLLGGAWKINAWLPDGSGQVSRDITLTTDGNDIIDQPGETLTNIDFGIQNISVAPSSLGFGSVTIGATSVNQILTISNIGSRNLEISNIELAGTDYGMFFLGAGGNNPCSETPFTISQNSSCTLSSTFSPTAAGVKSALIKINSNDMDTPNLEVPMSGTGIIPDSDNDGISNDQDNCPTIYNPNQEDGDADNVGNVCDNCPSVSNPNQEDSDADNVGDVCDNCLSVSNPDQADSDADTIGNTCDNCPSVSNSGQEDSDNDGVGNLCDLCPETPAGEPVGPNGCPAPDLHVTDLIIPAEGWSGQNVNITWTIHNDGSGDASGPWVDKIYLSDNATVGSDTLLGEFVYSQSLPSGEARTRIQTVALPNGIQGNYWIIVCTDADNEIYESDDNNCLVSSLSMPLYLSPSPDLEVSNVSIPGEAWSGQQIEVSWTIVNSGTGPTDAAYWDDRIYISPNPDLTNATQVQEVKNLTYLAPGESYSQAQTITLPGDISGPYYILIYTDSNNKQYEWNGEDNNIQPSSSTMIVHYVAVPKPDLEVTDFQAPDMGYGRQSIPVSWTITNVGDGTASSNNQLDWVMFSEDDVPSSSDTHVGMYFGQGTVSMQPGGSYSNSGTVPLPLNANGTYYLFLWTDVRGELDESNLGNNFSAMKQIQITPAPPADLEVSSVVTGASDVNSGKSLKVDWTVFNHGPGETVSGSWNDGIYLSADQVFDAGSDISLNNFPHNGDVGIDENYTATQSVNIPDGLSGTYYLFVCADTGNTVNEFYENNNCSMAPGSVVIHLNQCDLQVTNISASTPALSGEPINVQWTVSNLGPDSSIVTYWKDAVYLSADQVLDPENDVNLGTFDHQGELAGGTNYIADKSVVLPAGISGPYYLIVETDVQNDVYEHGTENNNFNSMLINVELTPPPDLIVTTLTVPPAADSGSPIEICWTGKNNGIGPIPLAQSTWTDKIYLCENDEFDDSCEDLSSVDHSQQIAPETSYNKCKSVTLQADVSGTKYIITCLDAAGKVFESDENNNCAASLVEVTYVPPPEPADLRVTAVVGPDTGTSGQSIEVSWTVNNTGNGVTGVSKWYDAVYLSKDQVFDPTDFKIGFQQHSGALQSGGNYNATMQAEIPIGLSGPYYLFVLTDSTGKVVETSDANNMSYDNTSMVVSLPPLCDLVVSNVNGPSNAVPGQEVEINWSVTNQSENDISGYWKDAIYLSKDMSWDIGDPLITIVDHTDGLSSNDTYNASVTTILPPSLPGHYYIIVRTDIRNNARESNETNNQGTSISTVNFDVIALSLNSPHSSSISTGGEHYYRIDAESGEDLIFTLDCASDNTYSELYVRYADVPDKIHYDYIYGKPFQPDHEIIIPNTKAGTYYILVRGLTVPEGTVNYAITANLLSFEIRSISPDSSGNSGKTTISVSGAKFDRNIQASLIGPDSSDYGSEKIYFIDSTEIYASFNLSSLIPGVYDLRVTNPDASTAIKKNAFQITQGETGGILNARLVLPGAVRPDTQNTIWIEYSNVGDADLPAPLFVVSSSTDTPLRLFSDESFKNIPVQVLGINFSGPAGVLPPGASFRIPLYFIASGTGEESRFALQIMDKPSDPIDWETAEKELKPQDVDPSLWEPMWSNLMNQIGDYWGPYVEILRKNATQLSLREERTHDVRKLFGLETTKALGVGVGIISGRVLNFNTGGSLANATVKALQTNGSDYAEAMTGSDGSFRLSGLFPGEYNLSVEDYVIKQGAQATLIQDQDLLEQMIKVVPGGIISGNVTNADNLNPIDGSYVLATNVDGVVISSTTDETGSYSIKGLAAGAWKVFAYAQGFVTSEEFPAELEVGGALSLNFALVPGASVSGTITDSNGNPIAGAIVFAYGADGKEGSAATDQNGNYEIIGLAPGIYTITVKADGYVVADQGIDELSQGEIQNGVNLQLNSGAIVSGTVTEADGSTPVGGAQLLFKGNDGSEGFVVSDDSGLFSINTLSHGTYYLHTSAEKHCTAQQMIEIPEGGSTGLNIRLPIGTKITGAVTASDGITPVTDAIVQFFTADGMMGGSTFTDENGQFGFSSVPSNSYFIKVDHEQFTFTPVNINVFDTTPIILNFSAAANVLSGTVTSMETGDPIGGAKILAILKGEQEYDTTLLETMTDSEGNYSFQSLIAGDYMFTATANNFGRQIENIVISNSQQVQHNFILPESLVLSGEITDLDTGDPIDAATVGVFSSTLGEEVSDVFTVTNDGYYSVSGLTPGEYTVQVQADGHVMEERGLSLYGNSSLDFSLTEIGFTLSGYLKDKVTMLPIKGAYITVEKGEFSIAHALTDSTGYFSVQPLGGGNYTIKVFFGWVFEKRTILLEENTELTLECDLILGAGQGVTTEEAVASQYQVLQSSELKLSGSASFFGCPSFLGKWCKLFQDAERLETDPTDYDFPEIPEECPECISSYSNALQSVKLVDALFKNWDYSRKNIRGVVFRDGAVELLYGVSAACDIASGVYGGFASKAKKIERSEYLAKHCRKSIRLTKDILSHVKTIGDLLQSLITCVKDPEFHRSNYYDLTINLSNELSNILGLMDDLEAVENLANWAGPVGDFLSAARNIYNTVKEHQYRSHELLTVWDADESSKNVYEQRVMVAITSIHQLLNCLNDCKDDEKDPPLPDPPGSGIGGGGVKHVKSGDPNEKYGPAGFGSDALVGGDETLSYTVYFENVPDATAPAQIVSIIDQLDDNLDLRKFRVGEIAFGDTVITVPESQSFYHTAVGLDSGLALEIDAGVNVINGEAHWYFKTIDPATGEIPLDPLAGFLPPNDETGRGKGYIKFTIKSNPWIESHSTISNSATIIFDDNEPIETNTVDNTVENIPPSSAVDPLPEQTNSTSFTVSWAADDDAEGAGVAGVTVYVSEDGGPFEIWLSNVLYTYSTFNGQEGHTYEFYSIASDNVGNIEKPPSIPDALIFIISLDTDGDGVPDSIDNCPSNYNPDQLDTDGDGMGNVCDDDDDNDGMSDQYEIDHGLDPLNAADALLDSDDDGFSNIREMKADTDPRDATKLPCNICRADFDADGLVGDLDLEMLADEFGYTELNKSLIDTDHDEDADGKDLNRLTSDFGRTDCDQDSDVVPDTIDNCPCTSNIDQTDSDGDGIGDACE